MSIYSIESARDIPGLDIMFSETKNALRGLFNNMDRRGRLKYDDSKTAETLKKIQDHKNSISSAAATQILTINFDDTTQILPPLPVAAPSEEND